MVEKNKDYNIAHALKDVAAAQADEIGLVCRNSSGYRSWTFAELQLSSSRFAAALKGQGVGEGQRVMLMVRPSMEFICLTFALFQLGAVVILIDPGMGYRNLLRCVGRVRPEALIAIPLVHLISRVFHRPFASVRTRICVGNSFFGLPGRSLHRLADRVSGDGKSFVAAEDDPAAIIFTTGSTGPPKGVRYTHGIFHAQLALIREYYGIGPGEVDQPGFPLFALFSTALGARAVIPDMDPTRPAQVDPARFIRSILDHQVTYSFGSPAIWNVVSHYCQENNIVLPVRKVLMAGAPVPGELIERVRQIMAPAGEVHTPYGATESLPVTSMRGSEVLEETWRLSRRGGGTCVGRPLPGIIVSIIRPVDGPVGDWDEVEELPPGEIGEIVVKGPVVTPAYDHDDKETLLAKIPDKDGVRHRMGDMGYLDDQGRLWFCGRKAHRVLTREGVLYSVPCEAVFNEHPRVFRSALVGVGRPGEQKPVLIVEFFRDGDATAGLEQELRQLARANPLTRSIDTFMVHSGFPVDIRHNAKIFREKLAAWAEARLKEGC